MISLDHLNPNQKKATTKTEGPVMILAGAGSGKTRTLVSRITYLLGELNIPQHQVLAVTFSNKAAREMRERVAKEINSDLGSLQITTFHAFCAKLLRYEAKYLGLTSSFTIYDQTESKSVIKTVLGRRGISQKEIAPSEVLYFIEALKNGGYYEGVKTGSLVDPVDRDDFLYTLYLDYEAELKKSNALDFGGLICAVLELFDTHQDVLERYQKRFKYILVDEYQDTNRAQFRLVKLLSDLHKNICVVGDEDQSIYSWRGADIRNILDYEAYFPDSELIKLEQNYRSSKNIIEAASFVISKNQMRKGKEMWTDNDIGEYINIIECSDDRSEADFIAQEIKSLTSDGISLTEIAVFYRTNAQSRMLEDSLRMRKIPYRVVAGIKFYERKEIKDLLSYMRVVVNSKDSLALSRIINVPTRGVGATSLKKIEDEAIRLNLSLWETIERIVENAQDYKSLKLSSKVISSVGSLVSLIQTVKSQEKGGEKPSYLYQKLLVESGYLDSLKTEKTHESAARIENLDELLSAVRQYEEMNADASLVGFLETITLDNEIVEGEEVQSGEVSLMTIHGAKGLEYHYVFVAGLEETVFPSFRSIEDGDEAIEEERRLFYVAMTRAMKKLYLLFARGRMLWGSVKFNGPSRFLDEIPSEYYEWRTFNQKKDLNNYGMSDFDDTSSFSSSTKNDTLLPPKKHTFEGGSKVRHSLYGIGTVLKSEGRGADEKILIQFKDGMKKKFMVKFAPIETI